MFYCLECGEMFEEPKTEYEYRGEFWGMPTSEAYGVCPYCGSDEFDNAVQCDVCGEYTPDGSPCLGCQGQAEEVANEIKKTVSEICQKDNLNYDEFMTLVLDYCERR